MMIERSVVEVAARLRAAGQPYVLATAVCQQGSAYRRAGARLIVAMDQARAGSISGGCLESDIERRSWWWTRGEDAVVVTYDSTHDEDADGDEVRAAFAVGCNGVVDILLERGGRVLEGRLDPLAFSEYCARTQQRGGLATVYRSHASTREIGARVAVLDGRVVSIDTAFPDDSELRVACVSELVATVATGRSRTAYYEGAEGLREVFLEAIIPAPRLFVFGTGPDAVPLVALARSLGWDAIVCAPRRRPQTRARFALADELLDGSPVDLMAAVNGAHRAVVAVMSHDYDLDRAHLGALLDSRAIYIGVLGPRARTARMLADLRRPGADPRLHAPIGLELGAETPQEIALAIASEVQSVLAGVSHRGLRDRPGPIHARSEPPRLAMSATHIEHGVCAKESA